MKCGDCLQEIKRGLEERKRVEFHRQPDESVKVFGVNMPDGSLEQAIGKLIRAEHQKCYWAHKNKETRTAAAEVRATEALDAKRAERADDPGHHERAEQDWRDPTTVEIEELTP